MIDLSTCAPMIDPKACYEANPHMRIMYEMYRQLCTVYDNVAEKALFRAFNELAAVYVSDPAVPEIHDGPLDPETWLITYNAASMRMPPYDPEAIAAWIASDRVRPATWDAAKAPMPPTEHNDTLRRLRLV